MEERTGHATPVRARETESGVSAALGATVSPVTSTRHSRAAPSLTVNFSIGTPRGSRSERPTAGPVLEALYVRPVSPIAVPPAGSLAPRHSLRKRNLSSLSQTPTAARLGGAPQPGFGTPHPVRNSSPVDLVVAAVDAAAGGVWGDEEDSFGEARHESSQSSSELGDTPLPFAVDEATVSLTPPVDFFQRPVEYFIDPTVPYQGLKWHAPPSATGVVDLGPHGRPKMPRRTYLCRKCGQEKKGHVCTG